ncbi:hypothetical protein PHAVU_007G128500 [Phaseolus vulgaris]|uniref:Uncharacterized protein n=1 Tax=Phaseolus vulgaris TaxID=3885 RepID=V7BI11_PHAVU|nr:hypothetical protein PHAVU_007G128500g [Phaseolus vulgaris]ESW16091.1 hypothetical protein PHAVU_007G128500g [Phaseolus vulgaris]
MKQMQEKENRKLLSKARRAVPVIRDHGNDRSDSLTQLTTTTLERLVESEPVEVGFVRVEVKLLMRIFSAKEFLKC